MGSRSDLKALPSPDRFRKRVLRQGYFIALALANLGLRILPGQRARIALLRLVGQDVSWNTYLHRGVRIMSLRPGSLRIRARAIINHSVLLDNRGGLVIMRDCAISSGAAIFTYGHDHRQRLRPTRARPVFLGPGSFIYSRAIICPGVRLRAGTVLAPGAVLTLSTSPRSFWGGNPARCIKENYAADAENIPYRYALAP